MTRGRPRGSANIPWSSIIARLRQHPGRWMLLSEMSYVNARTIQVIRKQERRALRLTDGVIRCRPKGLVLLEDDRTVMCALYLKFDPKKERPHAGQPQPPRVQPAEE
ncbi:hypothetical protein SEA_FRANSOYER_71 [Microbacterium phage Fransoyer]|nr:hypothetical protein SEA_FRANSOYER_71 [Microbacterium phage Fransoyer]